MDVEQLLTKQKIPTLLLHSCCGPCSSYVLEHLSEDFKITIYFYNPNIYPDDEYEKRLNEQKKLINLIKTKYPINFIEGKYEPNIFLKKIKGLEDELEGGKRCFKCFELRLKETFKKAKELNFDCFTTTLTVSPYKNSTVINEIGKKLEDSFVRFLSSNFKKNDGYKRSIELSKKYNLYRQSYCGCQFSRKEVNK